MAMRYGSTLVEGTQCVFYDKYLTIDPSKKEHPEAFISFNDVLGSTLSKLNSLDIIFNLVDNDVERRELHKYIRASNSPYVVIDIGNEQTHGQLFASYYNMSRINETYSNYPKNVPLILQDSFAEYHEAIITSDEDVVVFSCAEADVSEEFQDQFLVANDMAATVGHSYFVTLIDNITKNRFTSPLPQEIRFSAMSPVLVTTERKVYNEHILSCIESAIKLKEVLSEDDIKETFKLFEKAVNKNDLSSLNTVVRLMTNDPNSELYFGNTIGNFVTIKISEEVRNHLLNICLPSVAYRTGYSDNITSSYYGSDSSKYDYYNCSYGALFYTIYCVLKVAQYI